jgi:O-antigen/teichoic acid export membrane protein
MSDSLVSSFSPSSLAIEAGTVLGARVVGAGLSYVVQVLFARWAGPDHYGAYSYAMAWTALLSTMGGLGLPQAIVRYVSEYQNEERWMYLKGVVRRSEQFVFGTGIFLTGLGIALVMGFSSSGTGSLFHTPLLFGFALIPLLALLQLQTEMCVARGQVRIAYVLPRLLRPLAMMGGATALVIGLNASLTATTTVLLVGAPVVPIWLVQRWTFRRSLPDKFSAVPAAYDTAQWLRTALPMLLITGFLLILGKTDLIMIGLLTDAKQVGLYRVASKLSSLVAFPMLAVNAIAAPRFAEQYADGNRAELQRLAATAAQWIAVGGFVAAVGLFLTSGLLLGLFGPSFVAGRSILFILVVGQLANVGAGAVGPLLTMTGHQNEAAIIYGLCALLNVLLNGAGILLFGLPGAAVATALSMGLWNVGLYWLVVRTLGVYPSAFDALRLSRSSPS